MSRARSLANLANSGVFSADASTSRVGINSSAPTRTLDVVGDGRVSGTLSIGGTINYEDVTSIDSIGVVTARDGVHIVSAGASIYSPANNELAFYTNGSERFRVDSAGNVGIGTNNPEYLLDIWGEGNDTAQLTLRQWNDNSGNTIDGPDMRFIASGGTIAAPAEMDNIDVIGKVNAFAYNGTDSLQYGGFGWRYYRDATDLLDIKRASTFTIETKTIDESFNSPRLKINETGKIGIGTIDPSHQLHVFAIDGTVAKFESANAISSVIRFVNASGTNVYIGAKDTNEFFIRTGAAERLRITSDGNVGIGTDNPTDHLEILNDSGKGITLKTTQSHFAQITGDSNRSGANQHILTIEGHWNGTPVAEIALKTGDDTTNKDNGQIIFRTASENDLNTSERLRITSDGRIGINDITPNDYELDIKKRSTVADANIRLYNDATGSNNDTIMRYQIGGTTATNYIYFGDGDDANVGQIAYNHTNNSLGITVNAAERLRITSAGDVGIGTDNPQAFIHLETPATTAGWQIRTDSYGLSNESGFYRDANDHYECVLRNGAGGLAYMKNNGGSSDPNLHFHVGTSEKMRITSAGNMGIGINSPTEKLEVDGVILSSGPVVDTVWYKETWTAYNETTGTLAGNDLGTWTFTGGTLTAGAASYYDVDMNNLPSGLKAVRWNGAGAVSYLTSPTINLSNLRTNRFIQSMNQTGNTSDRSVSDSRLYLTMLVAAQSMDSSAEHMEIQLSNDAGVTFHEHQAFIWQDNDPDNDDVTDTTWRKVVLDISEFVEKPSTAINEGFQIRFAGKATGSQDGYGVSNIYIHDAPIPNKLKAKTLKLGNGTLLSTEDLDYDEILEVVGSNNTFRGLVLNEGSAPRNNYVGVAGADCLVLAADEADQGTDSRIDFRIDTKDRAKLYTSTDGTAEETHFQLMGGATPTDRSIWRMSAHETGSRGYFAISDYSGGSWSEDLIITEAGLVGIGTSIPDTHLSIHTIDQTSKLITLTGGNKRNNYIGINGSDNLEIGADEDNEGTDSSIRFRVDGTETMRMRTGVDSAGEVVPEVYIGTTQDRGAMLHIGRNRGASIVQNYLCVADGLILKYIVDARLDASQRQRFTFTSSSRDSAIITISVVGRRGASNSAGNFDAAEWKARVFSTSAQVSSLAGAGIQWNYGFSESHFVFTNTPSSWEYTIDIDNPVGANDIDYSYDVTIHNAIGNQHRLISTETITE